MLNKLIEEIVDDKLLLKEELSDEPPKKFSRIIATLAGKDDFMFAFYSEHVLWEPKANYNTCGVRPYGDGHHIVFVYDPAFIETLSKESIYFLLAHEVYHILQDHHDWGAEFGKGKGDKFSHDISNITMDTWINTDLADEGSVGGFTMEPPFEGYAFRKDGKWGNVEKWVNTVIEKATKTNPGEKYDGPNLWDALYDWVEEMFKKYGVWPEDEDGGGDGEPMPNYPQPGMIIRGPNGQYGQVLEVDDNTKKVTKIEPLTKDEAIERVKSM